MSTMELFAKSCVCDLGSVVDLYTVARNFMAAVPSPAAGNTPYRPVMARYREEGENCGWSACFGRFLRGTVPDVSLLRAYLHEQRPFLPREVPKLSDYVKIDSTFRTARLATTDGKQVVVKGKLVVNLQWLRDGLPIAALSAERILCSVYELANMALPHLPGENLYVWYDCIPEGLLVWPMTDEEQAIF
ncbi:uncharacterized protein LOC120906499 [Anopheles arabiensis]|uniref:uncharacterized protein LOC120906499 n=1 Tax=Anopheles arabiensis TaxID=7173 RepID=UPI001AADB499|nr:uncharacterized protein LOC120906499 [Anopheles arabiensis]